MSLGHVEPSTNNKETEVVHEVHVTLLSSEPDDCQFGLTEESFGKGVLDSGCTKTISGETWMDEFLSTLTNDDKRLVEERDSNAIFRFGDGVETTAMCYVNNDKVKVPVVIGKH